MIYIKEKKDQNLENSGFYFVKRSNKNYWEALVMVHGEAPFQTVRVVNTLYKTDDAPHDSETKQLYNPQNYIFSEQLKLNDLGIL